MALFLSTLCSIRVTTLLPRAPPHHHTPSTTAHHQHHRHYRRTTPRNFLFSTATQSFYLLGLKMTTLLPLRCCASRTLSSSSRALRSTAGINGFVLPRARAALCGGQQRRSYMVLRTVLNPRSPDLQPPTDLPSPPKTILLLTTPKSATHITPDALQPWTNDGTVSLLAAAVESLPGAPAGTRVDTGHSWLITDHDLSIKLPPVKELTRSLTFALPSLSTKITLPLANTLFHNGAASTLLHLPPAVKEIPVQIEAATGLSPNDALEFADAQQDIKEAWDEMGELMKLIGQRTGVVPVKEYEIGTVEITLPADCVADTPLRASLPLKALTPPRRIAAGLGNILKQLDHDGAGAAVGASRELEKAVAEYVGAQDANAGGVSVFARLTPGDPTGGGYVEFLAPGVRVHRVLSGGGGWGSKAGLLSLDPQGEADVGSFAEGFENSVFNAVGQPGAEGEGKKPTGIVTAGEWVQFFAAEVPKEEGGMGVRLGSVPKVEELMVAEEGKVDGGKVHEEERVLEGVFGGLAEQGVWVGGKLLDVPFAEVEFGVKEE
ncbi:hypothetical protein DFP73DRAFT_612122 [Morchella snyderi]|nr:hypothetical protein DFP73DRAFT_612122 [Morchella snyderi]